MPYQTINPFTEKLVKTFPEQTDEQLKTIIGQAHDTFSNDWSKRSLADRKKVLKNAVKLFRERREELAQYITLEMGKLLTESRGEVDLSADILEYYADNAEAFLAPEKLKVSGGEAVVENTPLGVLFCIEPWNFPYYQLARVAGPNLMAGNTLIVKDAPNVPQCALAFEKLFLDGGAPKGTYTNVFLSNEQAAEVIADPRIRGVAVTGSERAGSAVAAEAGKALKKSTMELGGSDAYIVLDDADIFQTKMRKTDRQKSIFITGAASGIGRATALLFAERGWFAGLFDMNEKELRAVAETIGESGCLYEALDVTDPINYERAVKYFGDYTGQTMDVLFNCAGLASCGPFDAVSLDDLLRMVSVNVNGTIIGIHLSIELLRNTPGARIINMSSAGAFYGTPDLAVYSATKFAIRGLTEALNIEYQRHGISVSDVMPLFVDTPMFANQAYPPGTLRLFGFEHTAAQVAEVVWKAAHGSRVHWSPTFTVTMIDALSRLFPPLERAVLRATL
jgi:NAD(P)-dependent dehydrogenase (short-subunit alcohol dehydrogenase family)